jgi:DNA-binding NtrC family response regulator
MELTDSAMQRVQDFAWPGNIRQLKNFVEQISILEHSRMLDAAAVERYFPDLPAQQMVFSGTENHSFNGFQDRELIYKFLFDIKREVSEVKTLLYELLKNGMQTQQTQNIAVAARLLAPVASRADFENTPFHTEYNHDEETEYSEHDDGLQNLSLQDQEKEMIKKALNMHHGKRKIAARDLGISERTLYRKIKEYNLESL